MAVREGTALFTSASEQQTTYRPAPDRWSARQIIGHLIDSACNNHRRFVINQGIDSLAIDGYEQDQWVARQRYHETPASELVALWVAYNNQIARVIEAIPPQELTRSRGPAGSRRFPYTTLPASQTVTLGHVVEDYVGHIRHHLAQIRGLFSS
jgi:hypothetical protein